MSPHRTRLGAAVLLAAGILLAAGCRSAPPKKTADESDAVRRLRAHRDRAFDELEGRRPARPGPKKARAEPAREPAAKPGRASAAVGERPDWVVEGASARYPISRYVVGVGSCRQSQAGDSAALAAADNRARSEAAKAIRVRIQSEFKTEAQLVTEVRRGKGVVKKDVTSVVDKITSSADSVLDGLGIVERWRDRDKRVHWSLAALDRSAAAATMLDRMNRLRQKAETEREMASQFRRQGRALQALAHLNRAEQASFGLLNYRGQLRVISPAHGRSLPPASADPLLVSLWREAALAREDLRVGALVFVAVDGQSKVGRTADAALSRMLHALGLNRVSLPPAPEGVGYSAMKQWPAARLSRWAGGGVNCLVLARVEASYIGKEKAITMWFHFYQSRGEAVVLDLKAGRVAATVGFDLSPKTHSGMRQRALAAEKALKKGAEELTTQLKKELSAALGLTR